jgi:hypothetical protein
MDSTAREIEMKTEEKGVLGLVAAAPRCGRQIPPPPPPPPTSGVNYCRFLIGSSSKSWKGTKALSLLVLSVPGDGQLSTSAASSSSIDISLSPLVHAAGRQGVRPPKLQFGLSASQFCSLSLFLSLLQF